jgi:hypothetical protein
MCVVGEDVTRIDGCRLEDILFISKSHSIALPIEIFGGKTANSHKVNKNKSP